MRGNPDDCCAAHSFPLPVLRWLSPSPPLIFVSERGSPFTTAGFARMIEHAADAGGLELKEHPIQGWLGHRSITSTAVYTALEPLQGLLAE
jgi:site-specific recombinase XerD